MKLYTYTAERSLPRIALKGIPGTLYGTGMPFWGDIEEALMLAVEEHTPKDPMVILEVDASKVQDRFGVSGEEGWALYEMILQDRGQKTADEWMRRLENAQGVQDYLDLTQGAIINVAAIEPRYITVLGRVDPDWDWGDEVKWPMAPKSVAAWKRPVVTRLLRSIFLPQRKLYGARMGQVSAPVPDEEPQLVGDVELVWAAGKTFERGLRGAFGRQTGDSLIELVESQVGTKVGKLLGAGKRGAAYRLPGGRVLKVTMDAREVEASARVVGVRHPNLARVWQVFVVRGNGSGAGIIVRDAVEKTLDKAKRELGAELDYVLDTEVFRVSEALKEGGDEARLYTEAMIRATEELRLRGCESENHLLMDIADAYRELAYLGIVGLDFGAENFGIREGRIVLFDYGMSFVDGPQEVRVVSIPQELPEAA